jgi:hypothetical protein
MVIGQVPITPWGVTIRTLHVKWHSEVRDCSESPFKDLVSDCQMDIFALTGGIHQVTLACQIGRDAGNALRLPKETCAILNRLAVATYID